MTQCHNLNNDKLNQFKKLQYKQRLWCQYFLEIMFYLKRQTPLQTNKISKTIFYTNQQSIHKHVQTLGRNKIDELQSKSPRPLSWAYKDYNLQ